MPDVSLSNGTPLSDEIGVEGDKSPGILIMEENLQANTYTKLAEIVKEKTGHQGSVSINRAEYIEQYRVK